LEIIDHPGETETAMSRRSKSAVSDKLHEAADTAQSAASTVADSAQHAVGVAADALASTAETAGEAIGASIGAIAVRGRRARKAAKAEAEKRRKAAKQASRKAKRKARKARKRGDRAIAGASATVRDAVGDLGRGGHKPKHSKKKTFAVLLLAAAGIAAVSRAGKPKQ
jgi:hypothetical protein